MAEQNPPGFLQNAGATHTAEQTRNWLSVANTAVKSANSLVAANGVNYTRGFGLIVTQTGSPSMAVIIRSGAAVIAGTEGAKQGTYTVLNDADVTVAVTAAHATLNRIDIVCFQVQDTAYSGGVNSSTLVVVAGTPSGSPVAPSAPNNSITLAQIAVNASVTSIVNANITDQRSYYASAGGIMVIRNSGSRPAASTVPPGHMQWNIASGKYEFTNDGGTTWVDGMPYLRTRQTLGASTGSITFSSIPSNLRMVRIYGRTKITGAAVANQRIRINGNSTTNYQYWDTGQNNTTGITPENVTAQTSGGWGIVENTGFAISVLTIPAWDITTELGYNFTNGSRAGGYSRSGAGSFAVAGPYTSITLLPDAGSWDVGSDFQLEGIYA